MTDSHDVAVAEVRKILADTEAAMAMFLLGHDIGESEGVVQEYGHVIYERLGEALGINPNGRAALAIVTVLADSGRAEQAHKRMRQAMRSPDEFARAILRRSE